MRNKRPLLIILSWLMCVYAHAQQDTIMLDGLREIYINPSLGVYHTPDTLNGEAAWQQIQQGTMESSHHASNPGMAYPNDAYWATGILKNTTTESISCYLEIGYPQLDLIELYALSGDSTSLQVRTGDVYPFAKRPVLSRNFVLPIEIPAGEAYHFLLNLDKRESSNRFPITVYPRELFLKRQFGENLRNVLYFGFIALVMISSLFLGGLVRKKVFVIYALYVAAFGLWLFSRKGYAYQFVTSDYPALNRHFLPVVSQLAIMSLILYIQAFFKTARYLKAFHKVMNGVLAFFAFGFVVWALIPDTFVAYATRLFLIRYALTLLVLSFSVLAAVRYWRIDSFRSKMFLIAHTGFFLAILSKILMEYGIISDFLLRYDPIIIGFLIEIIVLSIAMGIILKRIIRQPTLEPPPVHQYLTLNSKAVIATDKIMYLQSDDHYIEVHLAEGGRPEVDRNSLGNILQTLPPHFVRIHRSTIVNLNFVKASYADSVLLHNGTSLKVSRKYKQGLKEVTTK